jgi:hypothetical protein
VSGRIEIWHEPEPEEKLESSGRIRLRGVWWIIRMTTTGVHKEHHRLKPVPLPEKAGHAIRGEICAVPNSASTIVDQALKLMLDAVHHHHGYMSFLAVKFMNRHGAGAPTRCLRSANSLPNQTATLENRRA